MNYRVDIEAAKCLRSQGYCYKQIALRLDCSEAWCAKHLKNVPKGVLVTSTVTADEVKANALKILENAMQEIKALG